MIDNNPNRNLINELVSRCGTFNTITIDEQILFPKAYLPDEVSVQHIRTLEFHNILNGVKDKWEKKVKPELFLSKTTWFLLEDETGIFRYMVLRCQWEQQVSNQQLI